MTAMRAERFPFKPKTIPARHLPGGAGRIRARDVEYPDWQGPLSARS